MSSQLGIDFNSPPIAAAIVMGETGMRRAAAHAEREAPGFSERAFDFLVAWVEWRAIGEAFSAETVVDEARAHGIVAPDSRAWGPVFKRAAGRGAIRRSAVAFQRRCGHGSLAFGWDRVS